MIKRCNNRNKKITADEATITTDEAMITADESAQKSKNKAAADANHSFKMTNLQQTQIVEKKFKKNRSSNFTAENRRFN